VAELRVVRPVGVWPTMPQAVRHPLQNARLDCSIGIGPDSSGDAAHGVTHPVSTIAGLPLAGQVAVVTGASGGIGRAIALALAEAGADVVVHGCHSAERAQSVAGEVAALGRKSTVILADIAVAAERERLAEEAWNWRGGVDIWINNAGADVLTGEAAGWPFARKLEQLWRVDVAGTIELSRLVGGRMKERAARLDADSSHPTSTILNIGWDQGPSSVARVLWASGRSLGGLRRLRHPDPGRDQPCTAAGWKRSVSKLVGWPTTAPI
jgi:uncharacterized protein YbjT (DUF2867 family)